MRTTFSPPVWGQFLLCAFLISGSLFGLLVSGCATNRPAAEATSASAPGEALAAPVGDEQMELSCEAGYHIVASRSHLSTITFKDGKESVLAKQNAMEECTHNQGKFLCYSVSNKVMVNLPADLATLTHGAKVKLEVNDDVDDSPGNGKAYHCTLY